MLDGQLTLDVQGVLTPRPVLTIIRAGALTPGTVLTIIRAKSIEGNFHALPARHRHVRPGVMFRA